MLILAESIVEKDSDENKLLQLGLLADLLEVVLRHGLHIRLLPQPLLVLFNVVYDLSLYLLVWSPVNILLEVIANDILGVETHLSLHELGQLLILIALLFILILPRVHDLTRLQIRQQLLHRTHKLSIGGLFLALGLGFGRAVVLLVEGLLGRASVVVLGHLPPLLLLVTRVLVHKPILSLAHLLSNDDLPPVVIISVDQVLDLKLHPRSELLVPSVVEELPQQLVQVLQVDLPRGRLLLLLFLLEEGLHGEVDQLAQHLADYFHALVADLLKQVLQAHLYYAFGDLVVNVKFDN